MTFLPRGYGGGGSPTSGETEGADAGFALHGARPLRLASLGTSPETTGEEINAPHPLEIWAPRTNFLRSL